MKKYRLQYDIKKLPGESDRELLRRFYEGEFVKFESTLRTMNDPFGTYRIAAVRRLLGQLRCCGPVLDAGAGFGGVVTGLGFDRPTLVDISATALLRAREEDKTSDACYVQGDVEALPFANRTFALVICTEVLEHLQRPQAGLDELCRVCSDDLVVSVPTEKSWFWTKARVSRDHRYSNDVATAVEEYLGHIHYWSVEEVSAFLEHRNFHVVRLSGAFGILPPPWKLTESIVDLPIVGSVYNLLARIDSVASSRRPLSGWGIATAFHAKRCGV